MGVTFYIGGHGHHHRHYTEVKTPRGKRNFCIAAALFLSLFLAVLTFGLVVVIGDVAGSQGFRYECEELVGDTATTYKFEIEGEKTENLPEKFTVKFDVLDSADIWVKDVVSFTTNAEDDDVEYSFSVVFPKDEWMKIDSLFAVYMTLDGEEIQLTSQDPGDLTIAIVVIGIFMAVLLGFIIFNIKSAVKYAKQAKEEKLNPAPAGVGGTGVDNAPRAPRPSAESQKIVCPYCGAVNPGKNVKCDNCGAPLV